jgi:hypothetical protein
MIVKIANAFACNIIKTDPDNKYNKVTTKEAEDHFQLNWKEFSKELGVRVQTDKGSGNLFASDLKGNKIF